MPRDSGLRSGGLTAWYHECGNGHAWWSHDAWDVYCGWVPCDAPYDVTEVPDAP